MRGIIPAKVLSHFEYVTGRRIGELFDLIAGTSTGGILALSLGAPQAGTGRPRWTATDCLDFYQTHGPTIFPENRRAAHENLLAQGVSAIRYDAAPLEGVLNQYLGATFLSESVVDVLVCAANYERRRLRRFISSEASTAVNQGHLQLDFLMRDVARATSAAPIYFPAAVIPCRNNAQQFELVDGGIVANNPSLEAYAYCQGKYPGEDLLLISLGTGSPSLSSYRTAAAAQQTAGLLRTPELVKVIMDAASKNTHEKMMELLPTTLCHGGQCEKRNYYRLQTRLELGIEQLDDSRPDTIRKYLDLADELIEDNRDQIDVICHRLV